MGFLLGNGSFCTSARLQFLLVDENQLKLENFKFLHDFELFRGKVIELKKLGSVFPTAQSTPSRTFRWLERQKVQRLQRKPQEILNDH